MDLRPTTREVLTTWLGTALPPGMRWRSTPGVGRKSLLASFRPPITRLVGADLHEPPDPIPWLDEFHLVDLCRDRDAFAPDTFHVVLCAFALEHLDDPAAALRTMRQWPDQVARCS